MAQWLEGTILGGWNLLHSHRIFLHIGYLPIIFPYIEFPYINIWYDITIYYVVSWSWISWDFMRYNGIHRSNLIIWINGISTPNVWCVSQQEWWYNETLWRYHGDIYIIIIIKYIYIYIHIYIYIYIYIYMYVWVTWITTYHHVATSSPSLGLLDVNPGSWYQHQPRPSGKLLHSYGKIHHFSWENSL